MRRDKAYLSLIQWPEGFTQEQQLTALAEATGMNAYEAGMAVRRGAPQIVARMDPADAERAAGALHAKGATALTISHGAMAAAHEPRPLKRLIPAAGAPEPMYACELWRAEGVGLRMADVFLMIHGRVRRTEARTTVDNPNAGRMLLLGPAPGLAAAAMGFGAGASATTSTTIHLAEMLDLWLRDGSRLRLNAEKFAFDVLGSRRSLTERDSMALLVQRLTREARGAILDTGFDSFRCPPELVQSHFVDVGATSVRRTTEAPLFEFYSVWALLAYRQLLGS